MVCSCVAKVPLDWPIVPVYESRPDGYEIYDRHLNIYSTLSVSKNKALQSHNIGVCLG